jgi:hypothetical protein
MDEAKAGGMALVPGRECGACAACCVDLAIAESGMRKLPNVRCEHLRANGGCGIYDARPLICRTYHCLWRGLDNLDDSWRPDRCGILIQWAKVPPGLAVEHAVDLVLIGQPETLRTDRFAGLAGGFIDSGTATFLQVSNGTDFAPSRALLNRLLGPAVAARDHAEIKHLIWTAYGQLKALPPVPATIDYYGSP